MTTRSFLLALSLVIAGCSSSTDGLASSPEQPVDLDEDWRVSLVREFNQLRTENRIEEASRYLGPDPRLWFGEKEGEGRAWNISGPIVDWYSALHGDTEYLWLRLDGETVLAEALVTDDFDRMLDIEPGLFELRWWIDTKSRKITGFFIISRQATGEANLGLFLQWAEAHYPDEFHSLFPDGRMLFEAGNVPAWISLLGRWRRTQGLSDLGLD